MEQVKTPFTTADAIEIQKEQVNEWRQVLKPSVFNLLKSYFEIINKDATTPEQVKRGTDIDQFVHNIMNDFRNAKNKTGR